MSDQYVFINRGGKPKRQYGCIAYTLMFIGASIVCGIGFTVFMAIVGGGS